MVLKCVPYMRFLTFVQRNRLFFGFIFTLLFTISGFAEKNASKSDYMSYYLKCHQLYLSHKWSQQYWPTENKQTKPKFSQVYSQEHVTEMITDSWMMERALSELFSYKIIRTMLQADLNRMAKNSRDPSGLKALFNAMKDDPELIANCVSRPYLIKKKLRDKFAWSKKQHMETNRKANLEMDRLLTHGQTEEGVLSEKTYQLHEQHKEGEPQHKFSGEVQLLDKAAFEQFMLIAKQPNQKPTILESKDSFFYERLKFLDHQSITFEKTSWPKEAFDDWWKNNRHQWQLTPKKNLNAPLKNFKLPRISSQFKPDSKAVAGNELWVLNDMPVHRFYHSAVWTGSEMIIWGGGYKSGARYNPASDSWVPLPFENAPVQRSRHHAFWTGTEMLIWGGFQDGRLNSGGRYSLENDEWININLTDAPAARAGHQSVWCGSKMLVIGGSGESTSLDSTGYDPVSDVWSEISLTGLDHAGAVNGAICTGDELFVWAGEFSSGAMYSLTDEVWRDIDLSLAPSPRRDYSIIWSGEDVIIWGGRIGTTPLDTGAPYNPSNNKWQKTYTKNVLAPKQDPVSIWTGNG